MSKRKFNIIAVVLIILPVLIYVVGNLQGALFGGYTNRAKTITAPSMPQTGGINFLTSMTRDSNYSSYNFYPNTENNTIADVREFMKVAYGSVIYTYNDVMGISEKVKDTVKISDGRINNYNANTNYANISFIIPKTNLEDFRKRIKSLTNEKLIVENISETNLLNEKVGLESRGEDIENAKVQIDKYKAQMNDVLQKINSTKSSIATLEKKLKALDPQSSSYVEQKTTMEDQLNLSQNRLVGYNIDYRQQTNTYNNLLQTQKQNESNLKKDNTKFDDKLETVEGNIQVNSIDVFEYLQKIFPYLYYLFNPLVIYLIFVTILLAFLRTKVV